MPDPTTIPIRTNVKTRLVELLTTAAPARADGHPVQIAFGWPGPALEDECIWFGTATGPRSVQGLKAGRKRVHDVFDIDAWVIAATRGQQDAAAAHGRCEYLAGFLCDVVANDPHLGGLPGLTGGATTSEYVIEVEPTDEGSTAIARLSIHCQASLA